MIEMISANDVISLESKPLNFRVFIHEYSLSLRTADVFAVVASVPPKNNVCEPERQNDFRGLEPFKSMTV